MQTALDQTIGTILRYDKKVTSYKLALVRAINDVVLSFPDALPNTSTNAGEVRNVAVPLRMLADFWIAYYWPFADAQSPIIQGQVTRRDGLNRNDLSFRPALSGLRARWEAVIQTPSLPSDGFFLMSEFRAPRRRASYPPELQRAYDAAISAIMTAFQQPIRYAGAGEYTLFEKPRRLSAIGTSAVALPGSRPGDLCLVIDAGLWLSFRALSLWIEALSIHEWCLFSERVAQESALESGAKNGIAIDRGKIYVLLTARPDNRRPLTWERNRVDLLMMEGVEFVCPWTGKILTKTKGYDIDHLLPLAVYPVNELWNLLPVDAVFNQHIKRDRIPSTLRLSTATPLITAAYENYDKSLELREAVREDASVRFSGIPSDARFTAELARHTVRFIEEVANARSVTRF
jgi:hypothetical protein